MKIYDCFPFYNELEVLELRLSLLYPYVDHFVLAESTVTHRGDPKPLYFYENREKFAQYMDKIIYVRLNCKTKDTHPNDWSIENAQRDILTDGLKNCEPDDIIIVSDADEIPSPGIIQGLRNYSLSSSKNLIKEHRIFRKRKHKLKAYFKYFKLLQLTHSDTKINDILNISPLALHQKHFYYYMNNIYLYKWCGSVISFYKNMHSPQNLRDLRRRLPIVINGGWHFSYMGGIDRILRKVNSVVDETPTATENTQYNKEYIKQCLKNGTLIYKHQISNEKVFSQITVEEIGIKNMISFKEKYPYLFL